MDLNKASEVYDFYLEEIEKAKYIKRTGSPGNYKYVYPGEEKKGQSGKKVVEKPASKITNKQESEGEKKMKISSTAKEILNDSEVKEKFNLYTHKDVSERLVNAIEASGYDVDDISIKEFDYILDKMEGESNTVKLDSNGESDVYEVKGEKVYFHKDKKSGSNKIVLADANTGEPVLSGTNQYLKFDSEKEASEWLNKNS